MLRTVKFLNRTSILYLTVLYRQLMKVDSELKYYKKIIQGQLQKKSVHELEAKPLVWAKAGTAGTQSDKRKRLER